MKTFTVYLAHPISGLSFEQVVGYLRSTSQALTGAGYNVLHPMAGKGHLRNEIEFKAHGYDNPVSANHAIVERDAWMVEQSDIVLADLRESEHVSIGCCMELAWAHLLRRHTIVVMEKDNIHQHAFVLECADIVFETLSAAISYLEKLSAGRKD